MQIIKYLTSGLFLICPGFNFNASYKSIEGSFKIESSFKSDQLKYPRVRSAYSEKWETVKKKLTKAGVDSLNFEIFIRIFKREEKLEVWARTKKTLPFSLVDAYPVCRSSGELGPKRKEGDNQVPEGFYRVSAFQPNSEYHLALKVNYPNTSDLIKGISFLESTRPDPAQMNFWLNLKKGFTYFETNKILPKIGIGTKGDYTY